MGRLIGRDGEIDDRSGMTTATLTPNLRDETATWGLERRLPSWANDLRQPADAAIIGVMDEWDQQTLDDGFSEELEILDGEHEEPPVHPPWRKALIATIGILVAAAMLAVPVWNVVDGLTPQLSDSGLEICGFDYCVVQDAVREAGHGLTMSRLTNTLLDRDAAQDLADLLVDHLQVAPVTVEVVDRIDRRIAGQYDTATRHILVERPARAWIVLHEVAHTVASGHGAEFQATVVALAAWLDEVGW